MKEKINGYVFFHGPFLIFIVYFLNLELFKKRKIGVLMKNNKCIFKSDK